MATLVSILDQARPSAIRLDPFPHLLIKEALPKDLYDALAAEYPSLETVSGTTIFENNYLYLRSAHEVIGQGVVSSLWEAFFTHHCSREFYLRVIDFWREVLATSHPDIEDCYQKELPDFTTGIRQPGHTKNAANLTADIQLDCQFGINSPVRTTTSVRGPHVDNRYKLFAALLYFRLPGDDSRGGELEFYRYRDERLNYRPGLPIRREFIQETSIPALKRIDSTLVERVRSIPYEPNTLVMWLNMPYAVHGVSPREPTEWPRRYVNFLGESYVGKRKGFFRTKRRSVRLSRFWVRQR